MPLDLDQLREHSDHLLQWTGYRLALEPDETPWRDFSYLTPADLADPDIVANVAAMKQVMAFIAFVAVHEDGSYLGYWLGPDRRSLDDSPIVRLDNEGQFALVGRSLAGALLTEFYDDEERFDELDGWFKTLGLTASMDGVTDANSPRELHHRLAAER
jgi:hypothetical protein